MNSIFIIGTLCRDIELRQVTAKSGEPFSIGNSAIAYNEKRGSEQITSFFDIKILGRKAEIIAQYFAKGSRIAIHGKLVQEKWQNKETGQMNSKILIEVADFDFMQQNKNAAENQAPQRQAPQRQAQPPRQMPPQDYDYSYQGDDNGIPF